MTKPNSKEVDKAAVTVIEHARKLTDEATNVDAEQLQEYINAKYPELFVAIFNVITACVRLDIALIEDGK